MTAIFDTHAHYDDDAFNDDREQLLAALPGQGIARVVDVLSLIHISFLVSGDETGLSHCQNSEF